VSDREAVERFAGAIADRMAVSISCSRTTSRGGNQAKIREVIDGYVPPTTSGQRYPAEFCAAHSR